MRHSRMPDAAVDRYRWVALAVVSFGTLAVHLDTTVNVALPAMAAALDVPISTLQWIIIGYVLTTASTLVGVGRLADLYGRHAVWNWGVLALGIALVLVGFSQDIVMLVACRILQSFGATMIYAAGPAIVTEVFPHAERGRALGIMTMAGQLGMAIGPLFGGWLVGTFGWPAIFWGRVPIVLLIALASWRLVRAGRAPKRAARFDLAGALTLGPAMVALLLGINRAGLLGPLDPLPLGLFAAGALLLAAFVWTESRLAAPMLDLRLFRNRMFAAANAMNLLSNLTMFGVWLLVPFYLVDGLKLAPLTAGLFLSSVPIATALVSPLAGWLSDRVGPARLSLVGLVVQVSALFAIARLDGQSAPWQVGGALILLGIATGLFMAPNLSFIMGAVPPDQLGVAGGVVTTMRSLGVVTGVALLTAIYTARSAELGAPGGGLGGTFSVAAFQGAFTFAAVLCLAAVALASVRGRLPGSHATERELR
ncbi:MAG: MFS transporter [Chloroflexi bacterium]|nr:MFS transporter [Chloroflexota bacterium]